MGPEMRREKRYAQCRFVDMSVLKRFMLGQVCSVFYNFAKARSTGANIKTLKFQLKYVRCLIEGNLLVPVLDHNFHDIMFLCQNHS